MPKGSPEYTASRREEIINACEKLYKSMSFREITLKSISDETSLSRPSVYNYFHTKEEIFLALMEREYLSWSDELFTIAQNDKLAPEQFADLVARSLAHREQLLKLLSMNHFDMEENSRPECLAAFKSAYGEALDMMYACLMRLFPDIDPDRFIYVFFPFMFGIFPYTSVSKKQLTAMEEAEVSLDIKTVYELVYSCVLHLLGGAEQAAVRTDKRAQK